MHLRRIVLLLLLNLALVPVCSGEIEAVNVYPSRAEVGDVITFDVIATPGELVPVVIEFNGDMAVSQGEYNVKFNDLEIPSSTNRFSASVSDVEKLDVAVKFSSVTVIFRTYATGGVASFTRSNVPTGTYDITVTGDAAEGVSTVPLTFSIEISLTMDENGEYSTYFDTDELPLGTLSLDIGGIHRTVNIEEEEFILPPSTVEDPPEPIIDPETLDPIEAADIFETYNLTQMSALLKVETGKAANIVENLSLEKAVEFITEYNASGILAEISTNHTVRVLEALDNITSGLMMNELGPDKASEVILRTDYNSGASIIRSMVANNVTSAAIRVEHAVKNRNNETNPDAQEKKTAQLRRTIGQIKPATLVELFQSIAQLPNTPLTVAELFEILDLNTTIQVIAEWMENGEQGVLSMVLGLLSPDTFVEVYNGSDAGTLFPLLSNETIALLPESTSFHVETDMAPETLEEGETVTITMSVQNLGEGPGHKNVAMTLDGHTIIESWIILYPGETRTFQRTKTPEPGEHTINSEGSSLFFTVTIPKTPANIIVKEIKASSINPVVGEPVNLTISLENLGETEGRYELEISLDGVIVDSISKTLEPLEQLDASSVVLFVDEGEHQLSVNDQSMMFTAEPRPSKVPNYAYYLVIAGLIAILLVKRFRVI